MNGTQNQQIERNRKMSERRKKDNILIKAASYFQLCERMENKACVHETQRRFDLPSVNDSELPRHRQHGSLRRKGRGKKVRGKSEEAAVEGRAKTNKQTKKSHKTTQQRKQ